MHYTLHTSEDVQRFGQPISKMVGVKPFIMLVHANWCGHCQMLKPEWQKAVAAFKRSSSSSPVVELEESVLRELEKHPQCKAIVNIIHESVKGYPTITRVNKLKKKPKKGGSSGDSGYVLPVKHFTGQRSADHLLSFFQSG